MSKPSFAVMDETTLLTLSEVKETSKGYRVKAKGLAGTRFVRKKKDPKYRLYSRRPHW